MDRNIEVMQSYQDVLEAVRGFVRMRQELKAESAMVRAEAALAKAELRVTEAESALFKVKMRIHASPRIYGERR
jgi:Tfp pilus assembly protein PilX